MQRRLNDPRKSNEIFEQLLKSHEETLTIANAAAEEQKAAREKAREERKGNPVIESKTSLSGRKNGKIVYTDGTEEILLYDDGIKEITKRQFGTNLSEVILPTSVTKIGYSAFDDCCKLIKIEIPESVTYIGAFAFGSCENLTHVIIPESVTEIGEHAFTACHNLETIEILGNTKLGNKSFSYCLNLKNIYIPNITKIGRGAFEYCMNLEKVVLPENLEELGSSNFSNCPSLKCVTIPAAIKEIDDYCFFESKAFHTVNISIAEGVAEINKDDFAWCPAMIWKPTVNKTTRIGRLVFPKIETVGLIIPKSVTVIGDGALEYIPNLKNIYYAGSKEDFSKIKIGKGNHKINGIFGKAKIHYTTV